MMNRLLLIIYMLGVFIHLRAQPDGEMPPARGFFETIDLPGQEPTQEVLEVMRLEHPEWFGPRTDLDPFHTVGSLIGHHITYQQTVDGIPVFHGTLKANLDQSGNLISFFSNCRETKDWPIMPKPNPADSVRLLQIAISKMDGEVRIDQSRWVWYTTGFDQQPQLALQADLFVRKGHRYDQYLISMEGNVVYHQDLRRYFHAGPDTTVQTLVFYPNPITSAKTTYGGAYTDQNDANSPVLNQERVWKSMTVEYDNGEFKLQRPWLTMQMLDSPYIAPPVITSPNIDFGRGEDSFEFVNAYYHLTTFQSYVESLGFTAFTNFDLMVDAHGTWEDNSYVTPGVVYQMILGDGGVDDAEDADVIIHEFGHVLSDLANGNANSGFDRKALDEGYGDYFAASYSRSISEYGWEKIFNWDAHNVHWQGRFANTNKVYPADLTNNFYLAAEIWSSALMELWPILGKENMDQLVIQSLFSLADHMTMRDAAKILLQVEAQLFNGTYYEELYTILYSRGLLDPLKTQIVNTSQFLKGTGQLTAFLESGITSADLLVYDLQGRLIGKRTLSDEHVFAIPDSWFHSDGVYIIQIRTPNKSVSEKAVYLKR